MRYTKHENFSELSYIPAIETGLEMLSEIPSLSFRFYRWHLEHEWDYLSTDFRNPDDPDMGVREQRFKGIQTILRESITEVSIRPCVADGIVDDDYADGQWKLVFYTTSGHSWSILLNSEKEARTAHRVFHSYITEPNELP